MNALSEFVHGRSEPDPSGVVGEQRRLLNLGYRMLGSLAEAEDAVQETYARWYAMTQQQREAVASPGVWLTTVASRVCLDLLGSARARRERYVNATSGRGYRSRCPTARNGPAYAAPAIGPIPPIGSPWTSR